MISRMLLPAIVMALALSLAGLPTPAGATASDWVANDQGRLRLVSAAAATGDKSDLMLGLQFELKPGWKIYWRTPGDAGYPPKIDWQGSDNLADADFRWPLPTRFEVLGLQSIGYKDAVTLPLFARLAESGRPLRLRATVDYLTCSEICVPQQAALSLDLPAGPALPSPHAHELGKALAAVPGDGAGGGLAVERVETFGEGDAAVLRIVATAEPPLRAPELFVEGPEPLQFEAPRVKLEQGGRRAILEARVVPTTGEGSLAGKPLVLTLADGERAMESAATPAAALGGATRLGDSGGAPALAAILGLALLGGLILNLMPCVLPVLSIKLLGLIGHGGAERSRIRLSFIASSAGIVASFLALAAAAVAVKAAGMAVGWGIQFQQPLFLVALVVIVTLFAANLWGLYEFRLPGALSGLGGGHGRPQSLAGHFLSGAFATVLATPCTAPFLGTAIGFALARGPAEIFAVFTVLGLGMAAPYLLVAALPGFAQRLPRPGRWMLRVKQVMALALVATAVWLLTVLAAQAGVQAAVAVALMMAAVPLLLAVRLRLAGPWRRVAVLGVAAVAALAFMPPLQATSTDIRAAAKGDTRWAPFDRDAIAALVAEGRTVFVDVTADWCITCQVNKATVVNRGEVAKRLKDPAVVAMQADWTRPDDGIAAYLASYGRYGIPFNAVYGPGAPDGIVLPELLTEGAVTKALDEAARPSS